MLAKTKQDVIHAFESADLDQNGTINLNEFMTMFRHIEANRFHFKKCLKIFEESADVITEKDKSMSFDKFTEMCVDMKIFTQDAQLEFLGLYKSE